MTQETLGYVKLEWTCPKCGSRNPATEIACVSCGAAQPQDVQFEQAQGQQATQDEALKKIAEAGADIHCAFCGTRNPATAAVCAQCGADLKPGTRREAGRVVGAYQAAPVQQIACAHCGAMNPETALKCAGCGASLKAALPAAAPASKAPPKTNMLGIGIGVAVIVILCICAIVGYAMLSAPRESQAGVVEAVQWQTAVQIEELGPVERQGWQDQVPADAQLGNCQDQVRSMQDTQPSGKKYNKVCGTPYTVDTGSGVGKVVQDCRFEVLEPYCQYTVQDWRVVDEASRSGNDLNPVWPNPALSSNQRLGDQRAEFIVVFETDKGQYAYSVNSPQEFEKFTVDSEWTLNINALGQIVSVEPVR